MDMLYVPAGWKAPEPPAPPTPLTEKELALATKMMIEAVLWPSDADAVKSVMAAHPDATPELMEKLEVFGLAEVAERAVKDGTLVMLTAAELAER